MTRVALVGKSLCHAQHDLLDSIAVTFGVE